MKVFASDFLELMAEETIIPSDSWTWEPANPEIKFIYAANRGTATRSSTNAGEKDTETDSDQANEGK